MCNLGYGVLKYALFFINFIVFVSTILFLVNTHIFLNIISVLKVRVSSRDLP